MPDLRGWKAEAHFALACVEARRSAGQGGPKVSPILLQPEHALGWREHALDDLEEAIRLGFGDRARAAADDDLELLKRSARFGQLLESLR